MLDQRAPPSPDNYWQKPLYRRRRNAFSFPIVDGAFVIPQDGDAEDILNFEGMEEGGSGDSSPWSEESLSPRRGLPDSEGEEWYRLTILRREVDGGNEES